MPTRAATNDLEIEKEGNTDDLEYPFPYFSKIRVSLRMIRNASVLFLIRKSSKPIDSPEG